MTRLLWTQDEIALLVAGARSLPGRSGAAVHRKRFYLGLTKSHVYGHRICTSCEKHRPTECFSKKQRRCDDCVNAKGMMGARKCKKCLDRFPLEKFATDIAKGREPSKCDGCHAAKEIFLEKTRSKPERVRPQWSRSEIERIEAGDWCLPGRSAEAVRNKARALGIPLPPPRNRLPDSRKLAVLHLVRKGEEYRWIAARFGTTKNAVVGIVHRNRKMLYAIAAEAQSRAA